MKKFISLVLTFLMICGSLFLMTACSGSENENDDNLYFVTHFFTV